MTEVGEPSAIDVGPRGLHARGTGHRRRLVEVVPGVVDASAVALPNSHVIPDEESNCDASVPVFDWLDSDKEDELDALSRNVEGATQVDRDEPRVCWPFRTIVAHGSRRRHSDLVRPANHRRPVWADVW